MKIAYIPFQSQGNRYIDQMKLAFSTLGEVFEVHYRQLSLYKWHTFDLAVFNWRESYFVHRTTGQPNIIGIGKEFARALLFKCIAKKTCLVLHNNYPHETSPDHIQTIQKIQRLYSKLFTHSICHSGEQRAANAHYVPHPRYCAPPVLHQSIAGHYFVIFGRIQAYKNIESIFPHLSPTCKLIIAGPCADPQYLKQLQEQAPANVTIQEGFMDDAKAMHLVSHAKGLLLLGNNPNMIVSGSFHYGMSCNCPVFALETPYLQWYKHHMNGHNLFIAKNIEHLAQQIESSLEMAYDQAAAQHYHAEHSIEQVGKHLHSLFSKDQS